MCSHTAGADSRQYRELLCDAEIASRWRVIAFDLPYHGRSMPPGSWWKKEYLLTTRLYADTVMAFVRALGLEHPVVLGCSMGGAVVLELALRYASELGAVIGLEAASNIEGRFTDWSVMPDVNGSEMIATWIYGLMAPQSPEASRREVWWIYGQGGPGVYRGDTYFYSIDWDLRARGRDRHLRMPCLPADRRVRLRLCPGRDWFDCCGHPRSLQHDDGRHRSLPDGRELPSFQVVSAADSPRYPACRRHLSRERGKENHGDPRREAGLRRRDGP